LESYRSFFDSDWATSIDTLTEGSQYAQVTFDLVAAWKGAAIVRELPWLMMHSMKTALEAEIPKHEPLTLRILHGLERIK
jgi:hypothetical protein